MPPKRGGGGGNMYVRQNMLQIKEQEMLNREMRKEQNAQRERVDKRTERLKSQYTGAKRGTPSQAASAPTSAPATDHSMGEQIEVFVRETEPALSRHYVINEGTSNNPSPAPSPAADSAAGGTHYHTGAPCTATANTFTGAAAAETRCGKPSAPTGAARRSNKQMLPSNEATPTAAGGGGSAARPSSSQSSVHKAGHIPAYLKQRKQELQDEKQLFEQQLEETKQRAKYPPGQVPLAQQEKDEILKGLEAKKGDLLLELNKLPMRFDTTSIRKRRNEIEEQIRDIENRVGLFSRKQVFVPGA